MGSSCARRRISAAFTCSASEGAAINFYKHHIGDYAAATSHLSILEDGTFRRMLCVYYRDEKPLPLDLKAVQRLVGARTAGERAAVKTILEEFFTRTDEGWRNKRCDEEITRASAQADTNRRIAEEREARRRAVNTAREPHESCNETCDESSPVREPSQTPDTRHQTRALHSESLPGGTRAHARTPTREAADGEGVIEGHEDEQHRAAAPNPVAPFAIALNRLGVRCTAMNPDLVAYVSEGGTVEHLTAVAQHPDCQGKPVAYVARFARRELAQPAAVIERGRAARLGLAARAYEPRPSLASICASMVLSDDAGSTIEGEWSSLGDAA